MGKKKSTTVKRRLKPPSFTGSPPTIQDIASVLANKLDEGLTMWAKKQMGSDFEKYKDQALRDFITLVFLHMGVFDCDFIRAAQQVPFYIPRRFGKAKGEVWALDPDKVLSDYERSRATVREKIIAKTWRNESARRMTLKNILPGLPDSLFKECCRLQKSSEIAYVFVAWKYNLSSGANLKKHITLLRKPEKIISLLVKQIGKKAGYPVKPHH